MTGLTGSEQERYKRQMLLKNWGEEGQLRLKSSSVFIAGAGGLGSAVSYYLTAAGVGEIRICDADTIEPSNLNRQILHNTSRIGMSKAASAKETLSALNPEIKISIYSEYLTEETVEQAVGTPDIAVDCLDNYKARFVLNAYCVKHGIPLVHGAITNLQGQVTLLNPPMTPCLKCLFPEVPDFSSAPGPVVGAAVGVMGSLEALETLKYLTGIGTTLAGRLLVFDGAEMLFDSFEIERNPTCPECGGLS